MADGMITRWRREGLRPLAGSAMMLALALAQLPAPAEAGPFDPGLGRRAERGLQEGPYGRAAVAAGISVTLPFQTTQSGSALAETRLALELGLRRPAALATPAAAFDPVRERPLARLSWEPGGRENMLRLNGLVLWRMEPAAAAGWTEAAGLPHAGMAARPAAGRNDDGKKQEDKPRAGQIAKWMLIGGGIFIGVSTIIVLAAFA